MRSSYDSLEQLMVESAASVRPPERLTVSEAAEKYRKLNNPGSYVGDWNNAIAPYLVEIMDVLTSLDHTGMIFVGPARCGKSDIFFNYLGYTAICDPADMMIVHMTQNTARDWSQGDLKRVFRHSPDIGSTVMTGRQYDNTHDKHFKSGMRLLVKWPTITELSGKTIPRLWLMDYDRMTQDVDGEGNPFDLARKRAGSFKRYGMCAAESSPGYSVDSSKKWMPRSPHEAPPTTGILALYNRGDRRRWYWRCVSCDNPFEPDFSLISYPDTKDKMEAAEQAVMGCPHCGQVYRHERDEKNGVPGKNELNRFHARWVGDHQIWMPDNTLKGQAPRSDIASFWLKGPAAVFTDWKTLVLRYLQAEEEYEQTGSQEALKSTVNTDQGLPYVVKGSFSGRVPEELKSRAKDLAMKTVPHGTRFLVAAIDVQKNRFVVQVHGVGVGMDIAIVDRFDIRKSARLDEDGEHLWVNPGAYAEDWELLIDQVMTKTYPLGDGSGREMSIKLTLCDSGGKDGTTANAYNFWRWLRDDCETPNLHRRFQLVKGASSPAAPRVAISYPDSERKDRHAGARGEVPVLFINTTQVKDQVDNMLARTERGGGMITFPQWLPDTFYVELTVEVRTPKGWENPKRFRNESWDLLAYCVAGCISRHIRIEVIDWDAPPTWAEEWDVNDLIYDPKSDQKPFELDSRPAYDLAKLAEALA